ncbi:MAG: ParB/RepB/Spo0J family partition protein [Patescibacteria group bacterium]
MAGLGLESLIPKKSPVSPAPFVPNGGASVPPENSEKIDSPRPSPFRPRTSGYRPLHSHPAESIFHIEVEKITPNPYQPRRDFNEENLNDFSQSIREFGIIQPIIVSKIVKETETGTEVQYQLVAGERRLMAAKLIGLERVPVIVRKIQAEKDKLEMALIENIQRSDLNALEAAKAYARLQDEFNLTQREIAIRVGKSREAVANTLRLLNLPLKIQEAVAQNKINESQARAILAVSNFGEQEKMFQNFMFQKMAARGFKNKTVREDDPEKNYWEKQLEEKLGAPVKLIKQGSRGRMVVQFFSDEEWRTILKNLLGEGLE